MSGVCPGCGEPYEYRVPKRFGNEFQVRDEYRHGPFEDGYIYVHKIPPEQGVEVPYNVKRPISDGGQDPVMRLIEQSEEFDELETILRDRDDTIGTVIGSCCEQLADLCLDMARELERDELGSDRFRIDDDEVLTDGGHPKGEVQTGKRIMESRITRNLYVVRKWVEVDDEKAIALEKELLSEGDSDGLRTDGGYSIEDVDDAPPITLRGQPVDDVNEQLDTIATAIGQDINHGNLIAARYDALDLIELVDQIQDERGSGDVVALLERLEGDDDEVLTDGGLPRGVADHDEVDVVDWADHLEIGDTVRFEVRGDLLEADLLGFSSTSRYLGMPVVDWPDELEDLKTGPISQLVLRVQDLVDDDQEVED